MVGMKPGEYHVQISLNVHLYVQCMVNRLKLEECHLIDNVVPLPGVFLQMFLSNNLFMS